LWDAIQAMQTTVLCTKYDLRYFAVAPESVRSAPALEKNPIVYQDADAIIFDLKTGGLLCAAIIAVIRNQNPKTKPRLIRGAVFHFVYYACALADERRSFD
jgi:hypothetical protein